MKWNLSSQDVKTYKKKVNNLKMFKFLSISIKWFMEIKLLKQVILNMNMMVSQ